MNATLRRFGPFALARRLRTTVAVGALILAFLAAGLGAAPHRVSASYGEEIMDGVCAGIMAEMTTAARNSGNATKLGNTAAADYYFGVYQSLSNLYTENCM